MTASESQAAESGGTELNEQQIHHLLAALRYWLADAVFRAHWATTKRDQGQLRAEAYAYGRSIERLYEALGVPTLPYREPHIEGWGRLDNSAERLAREFIGPADSDRIMGKRP